MPRLARAVVVGFAHHITHFVDDDRRVYLELLKEQADKYALELVGHEIYRAESCSLAALP